MLIVSQNKEKVLWFGRAFNALEYSEQVNHKGKKETVRQTKERCLQVLKDFCGAYENECYTVEFFDTAAQATRPAMYKKNIVYEFPAE